MRTPELVAQLEEMRDNVEVPPDSFTGQIRASGVRQGLDRAIAAIEEWA